jgi:hypothetical protein
MQLNECVPAVVTEGPTEISPTGLKTPARNGTARYALSGLTYVSYEWRFEESDSPVNYTHSTSGDVALPIRKHGLGQLEIRSVETCDHGHHICAGKDGDTWCAESWMIDHVIFFGRTEGGRRMADELLRQGFSVSQFEKALNDAVQRGEPHAFIRPQHS